MYNKRNVGPNTQSDEGTHEGKIYLFIVGMLFYFQIFVYVLEKLQITNMGGKGSTMYLLRRQVQSHSL